MHNYILTDDHEAVPTDDLTAWAEQFKLENRIVGQDMIGRFFVSTVFLGIDHNFTRDGPPILFETMIFQGDSRLEEFCRRYATWDEAEAWHRHITETMRAWSGDGTLDDPRLTALMDGEVDALPEGDS